jgi:predicted phage terminase large subunit-like protein
MSAGKLARSPLVSTAPVYPNVLTPAGFACLATGGEYQIPPHLDLLNRLLVDAMARRRKRIIVSLPPRHGKSYLISHHFPAFYLGVFPEHNFILVSNEADFAADFGARSQEVMTRMGPSLFGVEVDPRTTAASRWNVRRRGTQRILGGMRTVGAGGPLVGRGAHCLVIDDVIKNSEEAESPTTRQKMWDWFITTARTRLEPGGIIIIVNTRWHEDDLVGRLLDWAAQGREHWDYLRLPALAEPGDPLGRPVGEALWPERGSGFTRADHEVTRDLNPFHFEALYQGNPIPASGGMFQRAWFERNLVDAYPPGCTFCRGWDFAASEGKGDYTVGALVARSETGTFYVVDLVRGQWSVGDVDRVIRETAESDRARHGPVAIRGEEQPAAAGKVAAAAFVKLLAGYDVGVVPASPERSKATRARPFAAQCEFDHVKFLDRPWLADLTSELARFPRGKHDDIVDAVSLAFNELALGETSEGQTTVAEPRDSWSRVLA